MRERKLSEKLEKRDREVEEDRENKEEDAKRRVT